MISLSDLNAVKASASAYEFEYITPAGDSSGLFFSVLGGQSEVVSKEVAKLVNDRRRKEAAAKANQMLRTGSREVEFETLENDVAFGQRLAAIRLVGWRGITEPFTTENALLLCQTHRDIAAEITRQSDTIANFMKL